MKLLNEIIGKPIKPTKSAQKNYGSNVSYVKPVQQKKDKTVLAPEDLIRSGAKFARKDAKSDTKDLKQWTKQSGLSDAQRSEVQKGFDNERRNNPNGFAGVRLAGKHRFHSDGEKFKEFKGLK